MTIHAEDVNVSMEEVSVFVNRHVGGHLRTSGRQELIGDSDVDEDNLKGCYELEAVKRSRHDCSWVRDAVGRAVKVIYVLCPLPDRNLNLPKPEHTPPYALPTRQPPCFSVQWHVFFHATARFFAILIAVSERFYIHPSM